MLEGDVLYKNEKRLANHFLTVLVIVCFAALFFLIWLLNNIALRIIGITVFVILLSIWLFIEYRHRLDKNSSTISDQSQEIVTSFALLNLDGECEKEWHVLGVTAFLVGKETANREVDMELGDTHHSDYISNEHAVINFSSGCWYIEDLDSKHGVGIRKKGAEYAFRLKSSVPYKVEVGDTIYISKVKILVL